MSGQGRQVVARFGRWYESLAPRPKDWFEYTAFFGLCAFIACLTVAFYKLREAGALEAAILCAIVATPILIVLLLHWFGLLRLWLWKLVTSVLWALGFVLIWSLDGDNIRQTGTLISFILNPLNNGQEGVIIRRFFSDGYSLPSFVFYHAWLALWVALALLRLFTLGNRPLNWTDFSKFRWVFLSSLACAGYPLARYIYTRLDPLEAVDWLIALKLILPPFLLPLAGIVTVIVAGSALIVITGTFYLMLVTLPLLMFDLLTAQANAAHVREQKKLGIASHLARFHHWLRSEAQPVRPDDSKGARFASHEETEAARDRTGMSFGHYDGAPLRIETDKHVLIMASTRSGKGVTVIIPHLLRYGGSAFVLDPKGENARATGRARTMFNDHVHYLDPFGISGKPRSRFNPLAHFTPETMEAQSKAIAAALILGLNRDHWNASAQQLLAALILYVVASPALPDAKRDLVTVRKLLLGAMKQTLEEMSESDLADGLVADLAASFLKTPERELGSIISTAQRETEILDNPAIVACLSATGPGEEVDFAAWHRGTMTVYLCLSAPKFPVFNRWLRLVLTSALDEMTDTLRPPPAPVCFMLDELATLGHLSTIENAIGLAAGYGVQLVTVWQDVAQMRDLYKGRWASFIGNAGVRALFSLEDYETAEYWSKFIGRHLVPTESEQRDTWGLAKGSSGGETQRALISPEEIMMRYATGKMLVLKQGTRPMEADRVPYFNDRSLAGLWDDPRQG